MESTIILQAAYKKIFDENISYDSFSKRLLVQKTAYLLQEMGLNIGEYGFNWYKHGPYCQAVQEDAFYIAGNLERIETMASQISFTPFANQQLDKVKEYVNQNPGYYQIANWMEAIASIHYLLNYKLPLANDETILQSLLQHKQHLAHEESNRIALNIAHLISNE